MTQLRIKIGEHTTTEEILQWLDPNGKELTFLLTRSSGFEAGAEGLALSYLANFLKHHDSIKIICEFTQPQSTIDFLNTIFSSTFGYALIRAAKEIVFPTNTKETTQEFRFFAGKIYDEKKGVIGLGEKISVISFDPKRLIPKVLSPRQDSLDNDGLPLPSAFHTVLVNILSGMGFPEIGSQNTLSTIIRFTYESYINTIQHGLPTTQSVLKNSTRGISLSKIAFSTAQLANRKMSTELREYLLRIAEITKKDTNLFVVCISVMDMGDGIQNTLPSIANESDSVRLKRAFQVGASRKVPSVIERGLGLHKVVDAAFRLNAKLRITSAGNVLWKDFSLGEDRYAGMDSALNATLPKYFSSGTSIDIYIPSLMENVDQRTLIA